MKTKNVIVAFTIGNIAGRDCLSGVFDFVNAGHPWKVRYMQNPVMTSSPAPCATA